MSRRHRSERFVVMLTPGELARVRAKAETAGLDPSVWARQALLDGEVEEDGRHLRRLRREAAEDGD